jgi:predicted TIM-barrel fold metal-dependent hydrolase
MLGFFLAQLAQSLMHDDDPILNASLPIIDPHHHLWTEASGMGRYMPAELLADARDHNIVATVFIECGSHYREDGPPQFRCVGETDFANRVAEAHRLSNTPRLCAGIVAHADLMLGAEVAALLEAHQAVSPTRLRGVRQCTAWDPDPQLVFPTLGTHQGMMNDARFRAGFAALARFGLRFDAWLYHAQLGELEALARAFADTTIVLDHVGTPLGVGRFADAQAAVFTEWQEAMRPLAACPNVIVKLGGLGMPFCAPRWMGNNRGRALSESMADATRDYYLRAIDLFTPARCMFESNFPVDKAATSYRALWNSFKRITDGFSAADRAQLFHDTAARVYALALD